MRTNVELNEALIREAFKLINVKTKKELINLALKELVENYKKKNLLDLKGEIEFIGDYDYKVLRKGI